MRPLPDQRLTASEATIFGVVLSGAGLGVLAFATNWVAAALALATLAIYLLVYTPMKRTSTLSTLVGAVPGALPAVIGWSAARGDIAIGGWTLFAIVFLWQIPHFMAIAWMYREDYRSAGFPMLPVVEPDGVRTGQQALLYAAALLPVSIGPSVVGLAGWVYFWIALALGVVLLILSAQFARARTDRSARTLFFASIIYLPLIWAAMILIIRTGMSVHDLPAVNASLNAIAGILLLIGFTRIRSGKRDQHRAWMIAAFAASSLFLVFYVIYHAQVGSVRFTRVGGPAGSSHDSAHACDARRGCAAAGDRDADQGPERPLCPAPEIASWTFPIWLYVSVTGVLVYVLLYQPTWLL